MLWYIWNYYRREKSGWSLAIRDGQTNCSTNPCQLITKSLSSYHNNQKWFYLIGIFGALSRLHCSAVLCTALKNNFISWFSYLNFFLWNYDHFVWFQVVGLFVKIDIYADQEQTFSFFHIKLIRLQKHTLLPEF